MGLELILPCEQKAAGDFHLFLFILENIGQVTILATWSVTKIYKHKSESEMFWKWVCLVYIVGRLLMKIIKSLPSQESKVLENVWAGVHSGWSVSVRLNPFLSTPLFKRVACWNHSTDGLLTSMNKVFSIDKRLSHFWISQIHMLSVKRN